MTSTDASAQNRSPPFFILYVCASLMQTSSVIGRRAASSLAAEATEGSSCFAASATDGQSRVLKIRCLVSEVISHDSVNRDSSGGAESAWDDRLRLLSFDAKERPWLWGGEANGTCRCMMVIEKMTTAVHHPPFKLNPPSSSSSDGRRLSCVGRLMTQHTPAAKDDSRRRRRNALVEKPSGDEINYFNQTNTTDTNHLQSSAVERHSMLHESNLTTIRIDLTTTTTTTTTTSTTTNTTTTTTTIRGGGGGPDETMDAAAVSAYIEQRIEALDLSRNKLRSVASEFLENLSHLEYVSLSQNLLESFPRRFPQHVLTLDLSENRLQNLMIAEAKDRRPLALVSLNLTGNRLKELTNRTTTTVATASVSKTLTNLEEFLASNNLINTIEAGLFTCHFKQLKDIDLSRNRLTILANYSFTNLYNIQILNFSYNAIENIEFHAFYNSDNPDECSKDFYYQSAINAKLKSGSETAETCSNGRWPFLEILDLSHNLLRTVHDAIFLSPLCAVRELLLGHNHIVHLPRYVIEQLQYLEVIDLQHNAIVRLDVGTFTNQNLRIIDLSHNSLRKIISMTFLYLPSVSSIDLSYNSISYIYKYAFYRICKDEGHLIRMSLRGNQLESDGAWKVLSLFQHQTTTSICTVRADLRDNQITHIMGDEARQFVRKQMDMAELDRFRSWNNIQLDLRDNQMNCDCELSKEIAILSRVVKWLRNNGSVLNWETLRCSEPEVFQGILVSEFVSSSFCPVELNYASCPSACECKDRLLERSPGRHYINCSGRQLNSFPSDLVPNKNLTSAVDLSYNDLDRINLDVSLPHVTYLDLSHNHLTRVNDKTIARLPALEQLLLHDNHLQLIPYSILKSSVLKNVTISGNPLLCQFNEGWIGRVTLEKLQQVVSDWKRVRCSDGRLFAELNLTKTEKCKEDDSVQQGDNRGEEVERTELHLSRLVIILLAVVFFGFVGAAAGLVRFRANIVALRKYPWSRIDNVQDIVRHDIFISYSDADDAWVTGCLLDIIWNHSAQYAVCLQQQQQQQQQLGGGGACEGGRTRKHGSDADASVYLTRNIDNNQVTLIVLSEAFLANLWTLESYRSVIIEKLESQRHQFIFVFLEFIDVEGCDGELYGYVEQNGPWLRADDARFADKLVYYLPPPLQSTMVANRRSRDHVFADVLEDSSIIGLHPPKQKY